MIGAEDLPPGTLRHVITGLRIGGAEATARKGLAAASFLSCP